MSETFGHNQEFKGVASIPASPEVRDNVDSSRTEGLHGLQYSCPVQWDFGTSLACSLNVQMVWLTDDILRLDVVLILSLGL